MPRARGTRRPLHAGSWYEDDAAVLSSQIDAWFDRVRRERGENTGPQPCARAVIAPHAGYSYCGHVMAHAYGAVDPSRVARVFVLGPSHHWYTRRCALSPAAAYGTPLGDVPIDQDVYASLRASGLFEAMTADVDEAEHSLELHMAYIVRTMRNRAFKLVPILVGALSAEAEAEYAAALAPFLADTGNLFVVSSDFCHWGRRFGFTWHDASKGPIYQSIECLDREGMELIEAGDGPAFRAYLELTQNTICGRYPIALFLAALAMCPVRHTISFTAYDQSSHVTSVADSSVSYASAVVVAEGG